MLFPRTVRSSREAFALYAADDPESAWIRAQQLSSVLRLTPFLMGANVFSAGIVISTVAHLSPRELAAWVVALGAVVGTALRAYARSRGRSFEAASRRAFSRSTRHATVLGVLWGLVPLLWFPIVPPAAQIVLATLTAGMMSAGAFALGPLPRASLAYLGAITTGALGALWRTGEPTFVMLGFLLCAYAFICAVGSLGIGRKAVALLRSEREAERQRRMVTVLLRDFEEHAAEALWETTASGQIVHASDRLGELLRAELADVLGQTMCDVIDAHSPGAGARIRETYMAGRPFRGVTIQVTRDAVDHWWQLSAKPITAESGEVLGWRGVLVDATTEIAAERQLRQLAHYDSLTGLANRVTLHEAIIEHLRQARAGALLSMDLDHFKAINDTFGHSTGDEVLAAVAARLRQLVRPDDVVARLGGDEFAILIRTMHDPAQGAALAQRLLAAFTLPCEVSGRRHFVGLSIGIALLPAHGTDVDELLGNADLALYDAKGAGRGRVAIYSAVLGDQSRRRAAIEQALKQAPERGELSLHWQPQVDVTGWRIVAAEALIRWYHPDLGAVGPDEFIAVAEQAGLVTRVGTWALREACRTAARELGDLDIAVNISAVQLRDRDFVTIVRNALDEFGIAPHRLEIELTESIFMGDAEASLAHLRNLQQLGVRIALDDFGTGYSSLAYLRRFPFDTLKIDRAFIRELPLRGDAEAIVGTMLQLADAMRMRTVAEGVETAEQLVQLTRLGCQQVQGYLIARPCAVDDLSELRSHWPESSVAPSLTLVH